MFGLAKGDNRKIENRQQRGDNGVRRLLQRASACHRRQINRASRRRGRGRRQASWAWLRAKRRAASPRSYRYAHRACGARLQSCHASPRCIINTSRWPAPLRAKDDGRAKMKLSGDGREMMKSVAGGDNRAASKK